ncbi:unnamed protein product [Didymodactylos carnosus]|uniref:5'-3' DNA helicase ZGRF1-like N-terminal domain-containing protein n=1 Tax=Didymodactylos carnosus TaxID=1234261 RepID=A0A8S2HT24_9BILA|nr:unnamed protein product [Didymodactylos carnosus]CAF3680137.1 unnamed protein product [Didymodactylos carnosus]
MPNSFPVLYTDQKLKKTKVWQDGHLICRGITNSLKAGFELETDRYLVTIEEDDNTQILIPKFVNDPTMKNKDKQNVFVPPRQISTPRSVLSTASYINETSPLDKPFEWGLTGAIKSNPYHKQQHVQEQKPLFSTFAIPPVQSKYDTLINKNQQIETFVKRSTQDMLKLLAGNYSETELSSNQQTQKSSTLFTEESDVQSTSWSLFVDTNEIKSDENNDDDSLINQQQQQQQLIQQQTSNKRKFHDAIHVMDLASKKSHSSECSENHVSLPKFDFDENTFDDLFADNEVDGSQD